MRIERLSIDAFGHFREVEFGPFTDGITVFSGPNEAGKTTLLAFIQAVLFGFPRRTDPLWRPALHGGTPGGRITLVDETGARFIVERREGPHGGPLTVTTPDGTELDPGSLSQMLGNVSRDTFQNVFAFGLDQLSSVASLSGNEISSQIYGAALGTQKLAPALSELEKQAGDIFRPNGRTQPVYFLLQQLDEIDRQLREQDDDSETWSKLQSDLAAFTRESKELREAQRRLQAERAQIDVVLDASKAAQHAREQLAAHEASVPPGNDDGARERVSLLEEAERSAARLETLRQRLDDEERNLPRPGSAFSLSSVALLVAAGLALMAGLLAGGTALVAGVVGAVFFGGLAVMIWLGQQRQAAARRSRLQRLEGARAAYRAERDRLTGLLGQVGLSQPGQVTSALVEARRRLEAASQARRSHADRTDWLRQQVDERESALAAAWAGLDLDPALDLEERVASIDAELDRLDAARARNDQLIGETRAAIRELEAGTSAVALLREQQERLLEELRIQADAWSGAMLAREILTRSQQRFEEEHQPAVVQTAGRYLQTITAGRYERVTVSLDRKDIHVVQPSGARKRDTELSRGTREQLYLALRFGYITGFGQASTRLPVIVDDILVNFDPARARATAQAFAQLSSTNQVIVFTCHPSTAEHFQSTTANVQVIDLDSRVATTT